MLEPAVGQNPARSVLAERTVLSGGPLPAPLERRVATVERRAADAGIGLVMVGLAPLFTEPRLLVGGDRSWAVMPIDRDPTFRRGRLPIPGDQRRSLEALVCAGCYFPAVYSAHEIDRSRASVDALLPGSRTIDDASAADLVGPVPPSQLAVARSQMLGDWTGRVGRAARSVLAVVGAAALVPVVAAAAVPVAVVGAMAMGLDPVLFGTLTASSRPAPGEVAAWILLAQWTW